MKELKKYLNNISDIIYNFLKKISDIMLLDKNELYIKSIIKIILLFLFYVLIGMIAEGLIVFGTHIIYNFGSTARSLLSGIWSITVSFTYFVFVITNLYKFAELAYEDKSLFTISKNTKKDKDVKKNIFTIIKTIIKILGVFILIPLFIIDIGLLYALGIMVGYWKQGIYLWSLFLVLIGLILFFTTVIFIIKMLLSLEKSHFKKYLYSLIISAILISGSCIGLLFETVNYSSIDSLTTDFNYSTIRHEYRIGEDRDYVFYNNGEDTNMKLTIDDSLGDYIEVLVTHYTTNEVNTKIVDTKNGVKIFYHEDLSLELSDFDKLLNLGISCIKEKSIYNYTLLKYAKIEIRVNSENANKIKFVKRSGREYRPYEGNN